MKVCLIDEIGEVGIKEEVKKMNKIGDGVKNLHGEQRGTLVIRARSCKS
jgi:hypothetical protein